MSNRIIISASSDIGTALAESWLSSGHHVSGTYRTHSSAIVKLESSGMNAISCDLSEGTSITDACAQLSENPEPWDVLVLAPGLQDPIGLFAETSFDEWEQSVIVNFTAQLRIVRTLLDRRNVDSQNGPLVLFFAGGGTNNATTRYSAYTISKIALIKMCELLDAEIPDTRFTIIGPGWVGTKIHQSTIEAGDDSGDNYQRTIDKLASDELVPMSSVIECCDWVIGSTRSIVSGRNISLVSDKWGTPQLDNLLKNDLDMYKLRRTGNSALTQ